MQHPVLELELRRCEALAAGHLADVDALSSPRLVYVHAPGDVHGHDELMQFLRAQVQFQSVERRALQVHALGDVAWTHGLLRYEGRRVPGGESFVAHSFVSQVWCRADEGWQLELCQSTKVDESLWRQAAGDSVNPLETFK